MYIEALVRTPMDSPFHISLQQLQLPLQLSSHPVHMNAGSNNLCYGQVTLGPLTKRRRVDGNISSTQIG
jgi:hypothetical protein